MYIHVYLGSEEASATTGSTGGVGATSSRVRNNRRPSAIFSAFQPYDRPNTCLAGHNSRPEASLAALLDRFICHVLDSQH